MMESEMEDTIRVLLLRRDVHAVSSAGGAEQDDSTFFATVARSAGS